MNSLTHPLLSQKVNQCFRIEQHYILWVLADITLGNHVFRSSHQHKGLALLPKQAVDVMSCQVARLLQLTQRAIVPIGYHVQRKVCFDICPNFLYRHYLKCPITFSLTQSSMKTYSLLPVALYLPWLQSSGTKETIILWALCSLSNADIHSWKSPLPPCTHTLSHLRMDHALTMGNSHTPTGLSRWRKLV